VIYDLFLAPLIMQAIFAATNKPYQEWHPNTMLAGGFFYVAFGAILGVAVWNRTQEKLAVYNGPMGGGMMGATSTDMGSRPYQQQQPGPFQPPQQPYQQPQQPFVPSRPPQPPISDVEAQKAADLALGKP
jgi:hypothetical protein